MRGILVITVLFLLTLAAIFWEASPAMADDRLLEESFHKGVIIHFDSSSGIKKIILDYPNGSKDVLRGAQVENLFDQNSHLDGFAAEVGIMKLEMDDRRICVFHSIFIFDSERTGFGAFTCQP